MDAPGTAVEQYFNQLIHMCLLTQVVVSDKQGNTILACFGTPGAMGGDVNGVSGSGDGQEDELPMESNVTVSGARYFQNLEQLQLGTPTYITAQYHDAVVVQLMEPGGSILTLIGSRAKGHFTGGLLSLVPQIHSTAVYTELLRKVEECTQ
ncbi:hypothetical protein conserved [Leishmania donovani]|uniref:Uncharacterized protein n=3 Tax=Leishmania donovani species complex TaxID=38574 RepID=A4I1Y9_LEIIN|nr:conserved hypothetical protein [Leishmania infantum JPCM5]XP_003861642.1 hypothetical protein, conserved [Leishmania donovani]CAC9496082.1 hypothetical_protein_-_conserved [Leishmania infantum]AYU79656.1 hypothetical protein LdCL_260011100 [Leishmania donovani]TPP41102.1 hypothetical protein CGC21_31665 [Leishmania donovani]TPP51950.1 hypothetical protein CGC20_4835 [Leishmania donovani]CAJ1989642.1 hypothetical protein conserved [Leishmania donovani]|eukprot:XP_001470400.1 conserved hypothetical protein [Leishmania infantum JPCM5]